MMRELRQRWTGTRLQTRLTITIATTFIAAGVLLVVVQYLLTRSIVGTTEMSVSTNGSVVSGSSGEGLVTLADAEQLRRMMLSSVAVLVVFAVLAIAVAAWISRRSLGRVAAITELAREVSRDRLDERVHLTGPDDDIRMLGDTLDEMLERLQVAFRNQDLFIANASHQLRTPLTTTRAALEIPLAQGWVPVELEESFRQALRANARSEQLIEALLLLARGRLGSHEGRIVAVSALVESAVLEARVEAETRGISIAVTGEGGSVLGDELLLEELFGNLVTNAVRHNLTGGWVRIAIGAVGLDSRVEIANSGHPIAQEALERLADPFYRHGTERRDAAAGFGLGLAIARGIVEMHDGSLHLAASSEGGLVVTVALPGAEAT